MNTYAVALTVNGHVTMAQGQTFEDFNDAVDEMLRLGDPESLALYYYASDRYHGFTDFMQALGVGHVVAPYEYGLKVVEVES